MKNKTIIIEFVGPPGAGKTTSCCCFAEQLRERGLKVSTLQDIKEYVRSMSSYQKLHLLSKAVLTRSHTLFLYTVSLAFSRIYSANSIYRYVRLTLFDVALKQFLQKRPIDIVLLEQWIIQELWSATIFKAKSYEKIKQSLSKYYFKTDFLLYFDIDETSASERITHRDTNNSRFDRMDAKQRIEELSKYNSYLFELYENSNCSNKQVFSGKQSLQINSEFFLLNLKNRFNYS